MLQRVVRTGITAHLAGAAIGCLMAFADHSQRWPVNVGLSYLLSSSWIMLADLVLYREHPVYQPLPEPVQPVAHRRSVDLLPPAPPFEYTEIPPRSPLAEWESVASVEKLPAVIISLERTKTASVRSMMGLLSRGEVHRLQTFLAVRGWSKSYRRAQVLTDRGVAEVAILSPIARMYLQ